jgi:hypothetical protein
MKIISNEDWKYWRSWIEELSENQIFKDAFLDNEKLYDESFVKEVKKYYSRQ